MQRWVKCYYYSLYEVRTMVGFMPKNIYISWSSFPSPQVSANCSSKFSPLKISKMLLRVRPKSKVEIQIFTLLNHSVNAKASKHQLTSRINEGITPLHNATI